MYVRFQSALDILVVSLLVAGVIGELFGLFLGVGLGLVRDAGVVGCSVGAKTVISI